MTILSLLLVKALLILSIVSGKPGDKCEEILIKDLPDGAFYASSSLETTSGSHSYLSKTLNEAGDLKEANSKITKVYSPQNVRQQSNSAWCPNSKVDNKFHEFLEIDLQAIHLLQTIQIRRFEYLKRTMPHFQIKYKRLLNETNWRIYQVDDNNENILNGMPQDKRVHIMKLDRVIIARYLRIYPFSQIPTNVCLIMEVYGCSFNTMIEEYKIHQGSSSLTDAKMKFLDNQYDGIMDVTTNWLSHGLGLLTDLKVPSDSNNLPGLDYDREVNRYFIAWNKASLPDKTKPVDLMFKFETYQKFHSISIYTVNHEKFKIIQPKRIRIKSSLDGINYETVNSYEAKPLDESVNVNQLTNGLVILDIDLMGSIGRYILISMDFSDNWIFLSEISFDSESTQVNLNELLKSKTSPTVLHESPEQSVDIFGQDLRPNKHDADESADSPSSFNAKQFYLSNPSSFIVSVVVLLVLFLLFLGCLGMFSCIWIHRKRVNFKKHKASVQEQSKNLIIPENHLNQKFLNPYQNTTNGSSRSGNSSESHHHQQTARSCSTLNIKTDIDENTKRMASTMVGISRNSNHQNGSNLWSIIKRRLLGRKVEKYSKHSGTNISSTSSSHDPSTSLSSNQNSGSGQNSNLQVVNGMVQIDFNNQNRTPTLFFPGTPMMPFNHPQTPGINASHSTCSNNNQYINVQSSHGQTALINNYSTLANLHQTNYSNEQLLSLMNQINQNNVANSLLMQQNLQTRNFNPFPQEIQNVYSPINQEDDGNISCEYASTGTMKGMITENNSMSANCGQAPSPPPNHPNRQMQQYLNQSLLSQNHMNNLLQGTNAPISQLHQTLMTNYNQMEIAGTKPFNYTTQRQQFPQNPGPG